LGGGGIALVTYPGSQRCNIVPATALRVLYHSIYIVPAAAGTKAVSCSQTFCKHWTKQEVHQWLR